VKPGFDLVLLVMSITKQAGLLQAAVRSLFDDFEHGDPCFYRTKVVGHFLQTTLGIRPLVIRVCFITVIHQR
jgi:hypothetical protein